LTDHFEEKMKTRKLGKAAWKFQRSALEALKVMTGQELCSIAI
jgi:hypothetical protein